MQEYRFPPWIDIRIFIIVRSLENIIPMNIIYFREYVIIMFDFFINDYHFWRFNNI